MTKLLKNSFFVFVLSLLSFQIQAQTNTFDNSAFNTYLEAENAFMLEDYTKAFDLYKKVIKEDKDFDPAMFQLARIYLVRNNLEDGFHWAQEAYKRDPNNKWYALLLVDLYKAQNQYDDAIKVYKNLLKSEPGNEDYLKGIAQLYTITQQTEEAVKTYNQLEKLNGISELVSYTKRDLYLNAGEFDKAVQEMVQLSEAFPKNTQYLSMIAEMYMGKDEPEKAFVYYQKVLAANPDDPYIHITLADYYQRKNEWNQAFQNLEQGYANPKLDLDTKTQILMGLFQLKNVPEDRIRTETLKLAKTMVQVHPNMPGSHAIYGDLLFRDSLYSDAAQQYKQVLKIDSSRYAVWEQLLFSLNNRTQTQEMVNVSKRAISLFPTEPLPYLFSAVGEFMQDSIKSAINSLEKGLPYVHNSKLMEQFYMYLGDAYHQDKQEEKAFDAYDKCLEINPSNTFVLNNYAYYLALEKKNLDKAKTMSYTAVKLDPNPTNQDTYGWVLYQLGEYENAFKYIEMAIKGDDSPSAEVFSHMGDVYYRLNDLKKAKKYWKKAKKEGLDTETFNQKMKNGLPND